MSRRGRVHYSHHRAGYVNEGEWAPARVVISAPRITSSYVTETQAQRWRRMMGVQQCDTEKTNPIV